MSASNRTHRRVEIPNITIEAMSMVNISRLIASQPISPSTVIIGVRLGIMLITPSFRLPINRIIMMVMTTRAMP